MVRDLGLELVVHGEFPLLDELVNVLREVVDVLSGLGIVVSDVAGDRLVTTGTGHDHVLCSHGIGLGDDLPADVQGEVPDSGPEQRGGTADLILAHTVDPDSGPGEDGRSCCGDVLHPVGTGTSGEHEHVGCLCPLDLLGPPCVPLGLGLAEGVAGLGDFLSDSLVDGERCDALLDEPGPDVLPEFDEFDLGVADLLAVSASGTFVDRVDELGRDGYLPSEDLVHESKTSLVELVEVVDLSSCGDRLPGGLSVSLADVDTVTAHLTLDQLPGDPGEVDRLRLVGQSDCFGHFDTSRCGIPYFSRIWNTLSFTVQLNCLGVYVAMP